jgi:hypothetical protein
VRARPKYKAFILSNALPLAGHFDHDSGFTAVGPAELPFDSLAGFQLDRIGKEGQRREE